MIFDWLLVWFPPPEVARQIISFVLETWVKKPVTTSALFFIPQTVPAFWRGLSRHLVELDTIFPHLVTLRLPPLLPIPIIVLYLPAHQHSLPTRDRLAFAPLPPRGTLALGTSRTAAQAATRASPATLKNFAAP
jgi:hypothetical protein